MSKRAVIVKKFFLIIVIPAIIGAYFSVKYHGWPSLAAVAMLSAIIPGAIMAILNMEPKEDGTLYTYRVSNRGKKTLVNTEAMVDRTTSLKEAQREHEESIGRLGGHLQIFINAFLIPYAIIISISITLLGWITFIKDIVKN